MLMAAKYKLPVWPHAGGVGLCEYVQHMSMIDYIAISGEKDSRRIEFIDHLHEHFIDPCIVKNGNYIAPSNPGFSIQMKQQTLKDFIFNWIFTRKCKFFIVRVTDLWPRISKLYNMLYS